MHSIRSLVALTSTILAFAVFAPPASQAAPTALTTLTVTKECSEFAGKIPSFCTILTSTLPALVGAEVTYYGPELGANGQFVSSSVVLQAGPRPRAGTASGYCIVYFAAGPAGMCAFNAGTGSLEGLQAVVKVTVDGGGVWHWEGVESHGK